jgi:hypothetical protein
MRRRTTIGEYLDTRCLSPRGGDKEVGEGGDEVGRFCQRNCSRGSSHEEPQINNTKIDSSYSCLSFLVNPTLGVDFKSDDVRGTSDVTSDLDRNVTQLPWRHQPYPHCLIDC